MKDIKTKECKRAPKLKDPMSRMPKELMRDAVLKAKEKSHDISEAGSSGDSQESPTEYASRKITSAEEQAASVTVRAVSGAGRVMAKKSFEKIKERRRERAVANEMEVNAWPRETGLALLKGVVLLEEVCQWGWAWGGLICSS